MYAEDGVFNGNVLRRGVDGGELHVRVGAGRLRIHEGHLRGWPSAQASHLARALTLRFHPSVSRRAGGGSAAGEKWAAEEVLVAVLLGAEAKVRRVAVDCYCGGAAARPTLIFFASRIVGDRGRAVRRRGQSSGT